MGDYDSSDSKWNIDGAEHAVLFEKKIQCANYLDGWELDNCYWHIRSFRRELDAALKREKKKIEVDYDESSDEEKEAKKHKETEKEETDGLFKALTSMREEFLIDSSESDKLELEKIKNKFYNALENFYLHLCYCMKKHGIFYREGEDSSFAILKR